MTRPTDPPEARAPEAPATPEVDPEEAIRSLRAENERLGEIVRGYLDMLGFVSHELKGPLASILLNAYSLRDGMLGPLSEHQRKAAASMVRNLEYLQDMVRNYLDLTRIEQGRMEVQSQRMNAWEDVVAPALEGLDRQIQEYRMTVERAWPEGDVPVDGDPQLLRIVWANLIGNAVKYGREGGAIRVRATDTGDRWEFGVRNEGVGIAREKMGELFQKFHRLDQPGQPRRRGTGLGLFVTKEIVERHGGTIHAESEEGRWVEFVFLLPKP